MTREEAIEVLNMVEAYGLADEAKRMAIEALRREEAEEKGWCRRIRPKVYSAETHEIRTETHGVCLDLISRTDAIEAVTNLCVDGYKAKVDGYFIPLTDALINILSELPSAEAVSREEYEELFRKAEEVNGMANEILADLPGYKEPVPVVAYICDRRRCAICRGPDGGCDHTTDIKHAAHFKNVAGQYFERPYMEEEDDE